MPETLHHGPALLVARLPEADKATVRFLGTATAPPGLSIDGLSLPDAMHRCGTGPARALRLGPGEWLALGWSPPGGLAHPELFAADVTDGLTSYVVEGPLARALLASASSADFDAAAFAPGTARRTRFARATAVVECVGAARFNVYVDRSVAGYVEAWFAAMAPRVSAAG